MRDAKRHTGRAGSDAKLSPMSPRSARPMQLCRVLETRNAGPAIRRSQRARILWHLRFRLTRAPVHLPPDRKGHREPPIPIVALPSVAAGSGETERSSSAGYECMGLESERGDLSARWLCDSIVPAPRTRSDSTLLVLTKQSVTTMGNVPCDGPHKRSASGSPGHVFTFPGSGTARQKQKARRQSDEQNTGLLQAYHGVAALTAR